MYRSLSIWSVGILNLGLGQRRASAC